MWVYHSPIGDIFIKQLPDKRFGMIYNDTVWEASVTPQIEADNIYCHVTGCFEWDVLDGQICNVPMDLSEWEFIPN